MSEPSSNMKAVLILAQHPNLKPLLMPALNIERDSINWELLGYAGQSGGVQAALSWAYCLFCDELPPESWKFRDPFGSFFSIDREVQTLVLQALAARHGFIKLTVEDKPKGEFEKMVEDMDKHVAKYAQREQLSIVKGEKK